MENEDLTAAANGILSPRLITIPAGAVLYRIGNSAGKHGAMGPWWFNEEVRKNAGELGRLRGLVGCSMLGVRCSTFSTPPKARVSKFPKSRAALPR